MAQVTIVDGDGNEVGTVDLPLQVGSPVLTDAINALIQKLDRLTELVEAVVTE